MTDPKKGFRDRLKDFVIGELKEWPEWRDIDIPTMATFLQGASFLSGRFSSRGEESYRLLAWDLLGCLEEEGLLAVSWNPPAKKGAKPWSKQTRWKVCK